MWAAVIALVSFWIIYHFYRWAGKKIPWIIDQLEKLDNNESLIKDLRTINDFGKDQNRDENKKENCGPLVLIKIIKAMLVIRKEERKRNV